MLVNHTSEAEVVWHASVRCAPRLRPSRPSSRQAAALVCGAYTITGGLGGLGLRAAATLVEGGAAR
eukprot:4201756-Prymnesium_polylepis.1